MQYKIEAIFSAITGPFQQGVAGVIGGLNKIKGASALTSSEVGSAMQGMGRAMTIGFTVPLAAAGVASVKAFSNLDTAMVGVRKTTEMTDAEFAKMTQDVRNMSKELPASTTEIAGVAEAAGQLGIKKEHLLEFSKVMLDLGNTTNLSSEEAAMSLAKLAAITQMPQTEFDRLGSTIVELGNNYATTEADIVAMGMRLAATGNMVGLTEAQTMGLATAMSSVGIQAEAGGSAMSRVMQKMNTAVSVGGDSLEKFASVAGMSAQEFATAWETDPQRAITSFIQGLGDADASGQDIISMLKELGINGIRETDTLQRLAGAGGLLSKAMDDGTRAWGENTALVKEAELRYESFASKMEIVKNKLIDAGVTVGEVLAPYVESFADKIGTLADKFTNLDPGIQSFIIKTIAIVAAIGPVLMIIGSLVKGVTWVITVGKSLISGGKMLISGAKLLISGLQSLIAFLGPVGLAILAIVAIGVLLYKNWDTVKEKAAQLGQFLSEKWEAIKTFTAEKWQAMTEAIGTKITQAKEKASQIADNIKTVISDKWEAVKIATSQKWDNVKTAVSDKINAAKTAVTDKASSIKSIIDEKWESVKTSTTTKWENVKSSINNKMSSARATASEKASSIKSTIDDKWNAIKSTTDSKWNAVKSAITVKISEASSTASAKANDMKNNISTALSNTVTTAQQKMNAFKTAISQGVSNAVSSARNFIGQAVSIGSQIISGFVSGVKNAAGRLVSAVTGAVSGAINKAKSILGIRSPSRVFAEMGRYTDEGFAQGVERHANAPINAISRMANNVKRAFDYEMDGNFGVSALDANMHRKLDYSLNDNRVNKTPMIVHLVLGNREYQGFVDDISNEQGASIRLEEVYGY